MNVSKEPVAWAAFIRIVLLAAAAFGLDLTAEQITYAALVVEAGLALVVRGVVTPTTKVEVDRVADQVERLRRIYEDGGLFGSGDLAEPPLFEDEDEVR